MTELDLEARRLLDLTRQARTPGPGDKARMDRLLAGAGLGVGLGLASTEAAHAATGIGKAAGLTLASKWGIGIAVLALAGTAGFAVSGRASRHAENTDAVVLPEASASTVVEGSPTDRVTEPAPVAETTPVVETPAPAVEPPTEAVPAQGVEKHRAAPAPTLPEELDLLHAVQAKWRGGDARGALILLAVHRQRYPRSQLAAERDALSVLSLCATGRTEEARRIARKFLLYASRSPLRTSVEESCGGRER